MTLANNMAVRKTLIALAVASITQVQAAPPVTNYEYDANGNYTKITDGLNHATTMEYDTIDRLLKQSQQHPTSTGLLGQIQHEYWRYDESLTIHDPLGNSHNYGKDGYGNLVNWFNPDTFSNSYEYDKAHNLLTRRSGIGTYARYTYDEINRIKTINYHQYNTGPADETVTFTYDEGTYGKGKLTSMLNFPDQTDWTYNAQGQVIKKQQSLQGNAYIQELQYDSAGRLSRWVYPSGRYVDYGYNTNGKVNQIAVDSQIVVSNIVYYPNGSIKSYNWGNSQTYTRVIDNSGRPIKMSLGNQLFHVTYDNAGRITQQHRTETSTPNTPIAESISTYTYDNLDRVTSHLGAYANTGYQYDLNGNRTNLTIGSTNYAYARNTSNNQLKSVTWLSNTTNYSNNLAGNRLGDGQYSYAYHSSGRLKEIRTGPYNILSRPYYNGLGEYVFDAIAGNDKAYDDSHHLIGEYSGGDPVQETVYLGEVPLLTLRQDNQQTQTSDNYDAAFTGDWNYSSIASGYYSANYQYYAGSSPTTDKAIFTLTPGATQAYKVYARWISQPTNATNTTFTIAPNTAGSTPTTLTIDQTQNGAKWNYLGTYNLNTANALTVTIGAQGNGVVVADAIRIVPATANNVQDNTFFVHTDQINTPRVVVDRNNEKRWTWYPEDSGPFGNVAPIENYPGHSTFVYNLRFPGQIQMAGNLFYNYYRDYDPKTGRYIEADPIGLASGQLSGFTYVDGNPISYIDPMGLDREVIIWSPMLHDPGSWLGHLSSVGSNGENYSFGPQGWDKTRPTANEYIDRQTKVNERAGVGLLIGLSKEQDQQYDQCMLENKNQNSQYGLATNNCTMGAQYCLMRSGLNFRPALTPFGLLNNLIEGGVVTKVKNYSK